MSGKKVFDTKIFEDDNGDSGFLSGPIDRLPGDDEDEAGVESDSRVDAPVRTSVEEKDCSELDSGVILSEQLDSLRVEDTTPVVHITEPGDVPPLAILFQQDDDGDTQLHIAAVRGCEKSVGTLIRVCPDKCWLDLPNDFGHTALHLAVMSGHAVVTRMLVRAGASIAVRDLNGYTPVHAATAARSVDCLQALLAPVDQNRSTKALAAILNIKNYNGLTSVHISAKNGHLATLQTLLYYGADVNAKEGCAGWTAMHVAAQRGDLPLLQWLLKSGGAAVRARDYAGRTPRRLARRHPAFATRDGLRLFRALPGESDSETDTDDEYDSDDGESLFEKICSQTGNVASLVN